MKKPQKYKNYIVLGGTILIVVACSLFLFFTIFRFRGFNNGIALVIKALKPVIYGIVIAYMLSPMCNGLYRFFMAFFPRKVKSKKAVQQLSNGLSVMFSVLIGILLIVGLLVLVIPQLVNSIRGLIDSSQDFITTASAWLENLFAHNKELETNVMQIYDLLVGKLQDWLQNSVLPNMDTILSNVSTGLISVVTFFANLVVGVVVSIYLLFNRKLMVAQLKKILYAVFPLKPANIILEECQFAHKQFTSFISGNLLDALIIGLATFVFAMIVHLPYPMLIAVIVGVTNVIPFFGPFIGAIPSMLIILLVNPLQCLYFVLFILILQQMDGNVIKPKILGQTSGLSSFWVLFAILLFGGLFGFIGMLIGVPVFAVIYDIVRKIINFLLKKRELPTNSRFYDGLTHIDPPESESEEPAGPEPAEAAEMPDAPLPESREAAAPALSSRQEQEGDA